MWFVIALLMIISATVVLCRVHTKTKDPFAYTLMGFTLLLALSIVGAALTEAIRNEVYVCVGFNCSPIYLIQAYAKVGFEYLIFTISSL